MPIAKKLLTVAITALLPGPAFAGITEPSSLNFDASAVSSPENSAGMAPYVLKVNHTVESSAIPGIEASVVQLVTAVKTSNIPQENLPVDSKRLSPEEKAEIVKLSHQSPQQLRAFIKQHPELPRVSRESLGAYDTLGSSGSGFIISADGRMLCITNAHVANFAAESTAASGVPAELHIKLSSDIDNGIADKSDEVAKVGAVGKGDLDIAILEIPQTQKNGKPWRPAILGDSSKVEPGDPVLALGYPKGINFSVTRGIVSAISPQGYPYFHYIQTDAAINTGNSGGPLTTLNDSNQLEVVGMNTSVAHDSQGMSFAIESNDIKRFVAQYLRTGSIDAGFAGILLEKGDAQEKTIISQVTPNGPAALAGLLAGDVIVAVDGKTLDSDPTTARLQMHWEVKAKDPGQNLNLTIVRAGKQMAITIQVDKEPQNMSQSPDVL